MASLAARVEVLCERPHRSITVNEASLRIDEERSICIAIECDTKICVFLQDLPLQDIDVQGTAVSIDVATIWLVVDCDSPSAKPCKQIRGETRSRSIRAVDDHRQVIE